MNGLLSVLGTEETKGIFNGETTTNTVMQLQGGLTKYKEGKGQVCTTMTVEWSLIILQIFQEITVWRLYGECSQNGARWPD